MASSKTFCHETVLEIAETCSLLEVVLGQEHVPQPQLSRSLLQLFNDWWVGTEAFLGGAADLLRQDSVCWDAFFLDELFDLPGISVELLN